MRSVVQRGDYSLDLCKPGKMTQSVKALAEQAYNPRVIPGTHLKVEGENQFYKVALWTHVARHHSYNK